LETQNTIFYRVVGAKGDLKFLLKVGTDVHFPTDINLLFDAVRKMIQIAAIISQDIGMSMWRQSGRCNGNLGTK
jgi:hypothetical protein